MKFANPNDPLQSRVGKYVKALEAERHLREITRRIVKSSISVFDGFNDVRNNSSLAHDNYLIDQYEARFIFDAISACGSSRVSIRRASARERARSET